MVDIKDITGLLIDEREVEARGKRAVSCANSTIDCSRRIAKRVVARVCGAYDLAERAYFYLPEKDSHAIVYYVATRLAGAVILPTLGLLALRYAGSHNMIPEGWFGSSWPFPRIVPHPGPCPGINN